MRLQSTFTFAVMAVAVWLVSSCGGLDLLFSASEKSDSQGTGGGEPLTVSGQLAAWGSAIGSIAGGHMVLMDTATGRAHWGEIASDGSFTVKDVTQGLAYSVVAVGPDFRFLATLQAPPDAKGLRRTALIPVSGAGSLGTLTLSGQRLIASGADATSFSATLGVIPDAAVPFAGTLGLVDALLLHDLDQDGVPNSVDADWDGDGVANSLDPALYASGPDESLGWRDHLGLARGDQGWLGCMWLSEREKFTHRCHFHSSRGGVRGVALKTHGLEVEFAESPGAQNKEMWSVEFQKAIESGRERESLLGRLAFVTVTEDDGAKTGYVVQIGDPVTFSIVAASVQMVGDKLAASTELSSAESAQNLFLQAIVTNDNATWTRVVSAPFEVPTTNLPGLSTWPVSEDETYTVTLRLVLPAPMAGVLGSALQHVPLPGVTWSAQ